MKTRVSTKGRILLPVSIRRRDNIRPGDCFKIKRLSRSKYLITRCAQTSNEGLIDWLLACPQKGFYSAISSESTTEL